MPKRPTGGSIRKPSHRKGAHSVYSNLATKRKVKVDARSRQKAEYLASLPKSRTKRITHRLNPKRFFAYWFSKEGAVMALKIAGLGMAAFVVLLLVVFAVFRKDLALSPDELTKRVQSRTTKFYDRTGQVLLYDLYKDQQLSVVKPDQISDNMKYATVAIEDKDFYKHSGFDVRGITRSVVNNASGGGKQGASTITQQLARNVILEDNTRSGLAGYSRKLKELILAIELERSYSKDEILNFYLNSIGYGGTAYGVESAAQRYFNKPASKLSVAESAYIASIPQYPSIYDKNSPYFESKSTLNRQQTVIDYMRDQGYIKPEEAEKAKKVDILAKIVPLRDKQNIKAPHFVNEIINQLEGKYGADNVRKGGWRIITTLDWNMQKLAEKSIADNIKNVETNNGDNAALVAVDVKTNQVLAMSGSRKYTHPGFGQKNAATANLQYGSSMKPFVYGELFDQGSYGPGSVIPDTPQAFYGRNPSNFDRRFRGNISIRSALAESRNLPAMKVYTEIEPDQYDQLMNEFEAGRASRIAQKYLAYEVTKLVHGEQRADSVKRVSEVLFGQGDFLALQASDVEELSTEIPVVEAPDVISALVNSNLATSNSEARRFVESGAVSVNGEKVDLETQLNSFDANNNHLLLKRGKNSFTLVKTS